MFAPRQAKFFSLKLFYFLVVLIACFSCNQVPPEDIALTDEELTFSFEPTLTGAQILYTGNHHLLTFEIPGNNVELLDSLIEGRQLNTHYFRTDGNIVQAALIQIPSDVLEKHGKQKLTENQKKEVLNSYIDYEYDYIVEQQGIGLSRFKKDWTPLNSNLFVFWYLGLPEQAGIDKDIVGQAYLSTVFFNQILTLNAPVLNDSASSDLKYEQLTQIGKGVRVFRTAGKLKVNPVYEKIAEWLK